MASPATLGLVEGAIGRNPQANGLAIIISNDYRGTSLEELTGTHKDGQMMKTTFESIGFATVHQHNVTIDQLQTTIHEATRSVKYPESYKNICFVFSGHGGCCADHDPQPVPSFVYDRSCNKIPVSDIVSKFFPRAAPTIGNIPKLFFIDACRGEEEMFPEAITVPKSGGAIHSTSASLHQKGGREMERLKVPPESNILIAYSTMENYQSFEVKHKGGIWLGELSKVIREKAATTTITDILATVHERLKEKYQDSAYERAMTQPEYISRIGIVHLVPQQPKIETAAAATSRQWSQPSVPIASGLGMTPKSAGDKYVTEQNSLNKAFQKDIISKPKFDDPPIKFGDGTFTVRIKFTVKATGKEESFTGDKPEKTVNLAKGNAAKAAVEFLEKQGLIDKPSMTSRGKSGSSLARNLSLPQESGDPGKSAVSRLQEYCQSHSGIEKPHYKENTQLGKQNFQYTVVIKRDGVEILEEEGGVKGNKKDAKHSAAKKILDMLH